MKLKIVTGSPLFDKMQSFRKECREAKLAAMEILKEVNGEEFCMATSPYTIAGGISAITFPKGNVPEGWVKANVGHKHAYMPHAKNNICKSIRERIKNLPIVETGKMNNILGYKEQSYPNPHGHGSIHVFCPVVHFLKNVILFEVSDKVKYTPVEGATEILVSEFNKLMKEPRKKTPNPKPQTQN